MQRNLQFHNQPDNMKQNQHSIPPLVISSPESSSKNELTTEKLMKILEAFDDQINNHNKRISLIEQQINYWLETSRC